MTGRGHPEGRGVRRGLCALIVALAMLGAALSPGLAQETALPVPETTPDQPAVAETDGDAGADAAQSTEPPAGAVQVPARTTTLTKSQTAATGGSSKSIAVLPAEKSGPDYEAWERLASRAETALGDDSTSKAGLELLRSQLVDWRSVLQAAQSTNSSRINTVRTQISALGTAPAEGETEADEIAARRKTLTEQLVVLQAPGIAAEEAYSRADALIREIDSVLRDRQADELLKLWPSPLNPANWAKAMAAVRDFAVRVWDEGSTAWARPDRRAELLDNLPVIGILVLFAIGLIWRGRRWIEGLTDRLQENASAHGRKILALFASTGQIVIPVGGVFLLAVALRMSSMAGPVGLALLQALPFAGFQLFAAHWLGGRMFPSGQNGGASFTLAPERQAEGRIHATMIGFVLAWETLYGTVFPVGFLDEAATPVLRLPPIVLMGLLLWRVGHLLRRHVRAASATNEVLSFSNRLIDFLSRGLVILAVVGPLLGVVGYVSAAAALVYPAAASLGLLAMLFILQKLIADLHALVVGVRHEDAPQQALVPVLMGFALTLLSLPLFALIWGARLDDLIEIWTKFRQGFTLGETRISPTDFLYFAVLFGIGFMVTRLFQGALKSTILPKTSLDQGGQNAIVSGTGYIGIFIAALIAINATGIDLSGLAIVAGALSVGIGFGLQNIVSNFVSGIILLIERPVSEGDWIEVGNVTGTVKSISVRSTRIQTFDRSDVVVPNADLVTQQVTNWTRFNLAGRLIVPVGVDYGSDTRKVSRILQEIAEAQPLALLNPPPMVLFMGLGADSLNFEIRVILRDVNFSNAVRSEINHQIVERFRAEDVSMPFSQRDIWLRNPEALVEAYDALRGGGKATSAAKRQAPPPAEPAPEPRMNADYDGSSSTDADQGEDGPSSTTE